MTHVTPPLSRRTFLRGLGVTMALPWLESLPVWGQDGAGAAEPPVRFACLFSGNGFHSREWWAQGRRRRDGAWQGAGAAPTVPRKTAVPARTVQRGSPDWRHPQLPDRQPADRGAPGTGRRNSVRHQLRSGHRRAHAATRPRCRAWCWAASRRSPRSTKTTR